MLFRNDTISIETTLFLQGKDVAVIGGGNSAMDAVLQLIKIARQIHLINISKDLSGDEIMLQKVKEARNVIIHNNAQACSISGDKFVKALMIEEQGKGKQIIIAAGEDSKAALGAFRHISQNRF